MTWDFKKMEFQNEEITQ